MYTFSKNSWHYRLAGYYTDFSGNPPSKELCQHVRFVGYGIFLLSVYTAFLTFVGLCTFFGLLALYQGIWAGNGASFFHIVNIVTVALALLIGGCYAADKFTAWRNERELAKYWSEKNVTDYSNRPQREPSIVALWYKSFKEKFCPRIDFK